MAENPKRNHANIKGELFSLIVSGICFFGCVYAEGQSNPIKDPAHINIHVAPWYDSVGPIISVGRFSSGLAATNELAFIPTIREMKRSWSKLSFAEMYVAAIRLYDLGYRKESVYWFYSAAYRADLFRLILDHKKAPGYELLHADPAFYVSTGPYFNGYAFGDLDFLAQVIQRVQKEAEQLPDMKTAYPGVVFIRESEWPRQNSEAGKWLGDLLAMIKEQKDEIKQKRIQSGMPARFGKLTSREFPVDSTIAK